MDREALRRLEKLNQLQLNDEQKEDVLAFFADQYDRIDKLSAIDTEQVERMVHVMPIFTVVRDDVAVQPFTRDQLQKDAPETMDGYWQVPRLVE
ncbi:MAG: Asp-tRNA(Asn)/Glu-tRNA(Gln) amidotransferase subunit GatC [Ruminococcaceae bacterium]|nr:Asp-tRNA(Asn)/Glu-tRNA(Gln) amidotransferase subunit GatC [Oscillospiraceae bacterium]